jgi:hypothetical protein
MRLPDADGFIVAAQKMLEDGVQEVFLHDAEGAPVGVLLPINVYREQVKWPNLGEDELPDHWHLEPEMGEEVPWL